jgi:Receptor family ligand binding region
MFVAQIWEQYGIQRIEMMLQTLDEINANTTLLPGVKLGCDIRDTCWYAPVALEQCIDFIRNSIASNTNDAVESIDAGSCGKEKRTVDKPIAGLIGPGSSTVTIQVTYTKWLDKFLDETSSFLFILLKYFRVVSNCFLCCKHCHHNSIRLS